MGRSRFFFVKNQLKVRPRKPIQERELNLVFNLASRCLAKV